MKAFLGSDFAVLLLAHGGPESLDEIPDFLRHIRGGRPLSDAFIHEVIERYRLIGGRSPLRKTCEKLAEKLSRALRRPVYLGMRHWSPFIASTVSRIKKDAHKRVVVICLAPHFSALSIGAYEKAFLSANSSSHPELDFTFVESWHLDKRLVEFHAQEIVKVKHEVGAEAWESYHVLFTAHSLPSKILESGDVYVKQLGSTMEAICTQIGLGEAQRELVFQSASPSPEPWLRPNLEEALEKISQIPGSKNVLIVPIGFVAEHVEILYDIDVVAAQQAHTLGITLRRTKMPNDSEEMVAIIQGIVEESAFGMPRSVVIGTTERCFA